MTTTPNPAYTEEIPVGTTSATATPEPIQDVSDAFRHLALFGLEEKHTFQTFDDDRKRPSGHDARIFHGTFEDVAFELAARNDAGQGIFIAINQTDLTGREAENVTALRVLAIDEDIKDGKGAISVPFLHE